MADGSQRPTRRFSAFISYSSEDVAFARRLHRRLETYRLPRRLATGDTAAPKRLKPLFRDVDELTAHHDLSAAVREALAQSDHLIVICSPRAARSEWVGREIEYFRAVHGDGANLAALIDGDPETAFPPALRLTATGQAVEPLAADFRKSSGFRRLAMLKLVAALAGVELDQLVQRDAQRGTRRVALASAGGVAALAVVAGLAWMAMDARAEAIRKGEQATGLVDYILTDVRNTQERSGKLADLAATNNRLLGYFKGQPASKFTVAERVQQAKLLQAMGEDDEKRGDLKLARSRHTSAYAITGELLARRPDRTDLIFAHAQSEYWVGYIDWREGHSASALKHLQNYAALAQRLAALEPTSADWQREVAYTELNLGTYRVRHDGDGAAAAVHFSKALDILTRLAAAAPDDEGLQREIADAHAWIADSHKVRGQFDAAFESRARERRILDKILAADRENIAAQRDILGNELATARLMLAKGQAGAGLARLRQAKAKAQRLVRLDPDSAATANQLRIIELFEIRAEMERSQHDQALMLDAIGNCAPTRLTSAALEIRDFCNALRNRAGAQTPARSASADRYSRRWGIDLMVSRNLQ